MIRCIIVDDETPAREELKYLLNDFDRVEIVGEASHGKEAIELNNRLKPDLVFLDIAMPQLSGIDVAQTIIREHQNKPIIVFVTAFEQFAVEAFEVNAIDYLLKPISKERLEKAFHRITNAYKLVDANYEEKIGKLINYLKDGEIKKVNKIMVYNNGRLIPIAPSEILYLTVEERNTILFSTKGRFELSGTLSQLEDKLISYNFFRSHKSYLVNLDYIEAVEPWFNSTFMIKLKYVDEKIPVSRSQSKDFKKIMDIN